MSSGGEQSVESLQGEREDSKRGVPWFGNGGVRRPKRTISMGPFSRFKLLGGIR